ncbi:hypothetical protein F2Q69_00016392 [Brassica cretica]|uniref:Reverse transcriptase zinc-binding domain-containing protein n=1 Tax=Brassica cretica TaxID=69181 RepID=A0A8S9QNC6_BRACR|nr:hypothetical protein F2Q69_00016392 [Brassica cretica]
MANTWSSLCCSRRSLGTAEKTSSHGPNTFGLRVPYLDMRSISGFVALIAFQHERGWHHGVYKHHCHAAYVALLMKLVTTCCYVVNSDEYCWLVIDIEYPYWEVRRDREGKQPWTQHVWFKGAVPRHAFNFWICCFDRLPTRARMASWGLQTSLSCCLCGSFNETRDHLLLRCEFNNLTPRKLNGLASEAVIYSLRTELNRRLHGANTLTTVTIFKLLGRFIRNGTVANRNWKVFCNLMQAWLTYE